MASNVGKLTGPNKPGVASWQGTTGQGANQQLAPWLPAQSGYNAPGGAGAGAQSTANTTQPGNPYDMTYWANVLTNQYNAQQHINSLNLAMQLAQQSNQLQTQNLQYQEPRSLLADMEAANRRGAFYSSPEQQAQGDIHHSYDVRLQALAQALAARQQTTGLEEEQISKGIPVYNWNQGVNAIGRANQANLQNQSYGITGPGAPGTASTSTPGASSQASLKATAFGGGKSKGANQKRGRR